MKRFFLIFIMAMSGMVSHLGAQNNLSFEASVIPDCSNCNGEAILFGVGGVQPYTYSWSNGSVGDSLTGLCKGNYMVTMTDAIGDSFVKNVFIGNHIHANIQIDAITECTSSGQNNGVITLNTNDPNSTFLWSNGSTESTATGLSPGNYFVTVTNAHGCSKTEFYPIGNLDTPPLEMVDLTNCGTIIVFDTVGATNSHYVWDAVIQYENGIIYTDPYNIPNPLPGNYTLSLYTSCGVFTQSFVIDEHLLATAQITNGDCGLLNGAIEVSASGGVAPYTYLWNTGQTSASISNLASGNYQLTLTDHNGCSQTSEYQVLGFGLNLDMAIVCSQLVQAVMQDGVEPFTYHWESPNGDVFTSTPPAPSNLDWYDITEAGQYSVTVVDGEGCAAIDSIAAPTPLKITLYHCDLTLYASISGGIPPFTVNWYDDFSMNGFSCQGCLNTTYDPSIVEGQVDIAVQDGSGTPCESGAWINLDSTEHCPSFIIGNIYLDADNDCQQDASETGIQQQFVEATEANGTYIFGTTDQNGVFQIPVEPGAWTVAANPNTPYYSICPGNYLVNLTGIDTATVSFGFHPEIFCPLTTVDLSATRLRVCENNLVVVQYCNQGTTMAENATVEITLPPQLSLTSSTAPIIQQVGTQFYEFEVGDLQPGQCGQFSMEVFLSCNSPFGIAHCIEAHILPDTNCLPLNPQWNGANVELNGICDADSVRFTLKNTGTGDMDEPLEYFIVEDQIILMRNQFQLPVGEEIQFSVPANGSTWYVAAEQVPGHPGLDEPSTLIEACVSGNGNYSTGYVGQFPLNEANPANDILCLVGESSYDPNEKQAFPIGFTEQHFIKPNVELEYTLYFQNTGNGVANKVVLIDSLAASLNPLSIRPGASSHPYTFELKGNGVVYFTFENIMLPDSTTNPIGSQGFVHFRISQNSDNASGTLIENKAAIYFDHNPPVLTNTVQHLVNEHFIVELSALNEATEHGTVSVKVYPNPFAESAIFELEEEALPSKLILNDLMGRMVLQLPFTGKTARLNASQIPVGMYLFKIEQNNGEILGTGRVIKQ